MASRRSSSAAAAFAAGMSSSIAEAEARKAKSKGFGFGTSNPRDYQVVASGPEDEVALLNLYGAARCGPGGSILDGDPVDRIPIASRLLSFPAAEAFMMRAKGHSMTPRISEGDLVIVRKSTDPVDGRVYVCVNDQECLIKIVRKLGGKFFLESYNSTEFPIFQASRDFHVEGEVKQIISGKI